MEIAAVHAAPPLNLGRAANDDPCDEADGDPDDSAERGGGTAGGVNAELDWRGDKTPDSHPHNEACPGAAPSRPAPTVRHLHAGDVLPGNHKQPAGVVAHPDAVRAAGKHGAGHDPLVPVGDPDAVTRGNDVGLGAERSAAEGQGGQQDGRDRARRGDSSQGSRGTSPLPVKAASRPPVRNVRFTRSAER